MNKETATWNSWVEAPKSQNIKTKIKQRCIELGITIHNIYTEDVNNDTLDKILLINRETIFFKIEGNVDSVKQFHSEMLAAGNES